MSTLDKLKDAIAGEADAKLSEEECAKLALQELRAGWPPDGKPKMIPGMGGVAILEGTARMARFMLYMALHEKLESANDVERVGMIVTRLWFGLEPEGELAP